jgi:hypothetical protein
VANVRYWPRTMVIEVCLLFEHAVSCKNCISVSAQNWPNNRRFVLK